MYVYARACMTWPRRRFFGGNSSSKLRGGWSARRSKSGRSASLSSAPFYSAKSATNANGDENNCKKHVCVCARMRRRRRRPFRSPPLHLKGEGGGRGGGGGRSRQQQHRSMDRTLAHTQRHLLLLAPISIGSRNKSLTPTITFPCLLRDLIVFTIPLLPCSTYTRRIFFSSLLQPKALARTFV